MKPCSDGNNAEDKHQDEISANHNHQNDSDDTCPVTCICNCCGCQVFAFNAVYTYSLFPHNLVIDKKIPEYKSVLTSNFFGSIWQPPQINV